MSAGVGVWKPSDRVGHSRQQTSTRHSLAAPLLAPLTSLVRQVFFSGAEKRSRVLFVAAGEETNIHTFCEQTATVLSEVSGSNVAVVRTSVSNSDSNDTPCPKKRPTGVTETRFWRTYSTPISERLCRLPSWLFAHDGQDGKARDCESAGPSELQGVFEYFVFGATITDAEAPLFTSLCDAAVLVVTADRTRRESALQAKQQLLQYNIPLLGAVLTDRILPIPEGIYRHL